MNDCAAPRHDEPVPAEPHAHLCQPCKAGLRRDLRRLPALDRELEQLLDSRGNWTGGVGDSIERWGVGLPYNDAAAECRSQIRHDLRTWISWVSDERQPGNCPVRTIPAMTGWLAGWVTWASLRPWAGAMAGTFAENRGRAMAIIDPMPRAEIPIPADVNYCPRCGHTGCLFATVYQSAGDRRPSLVTCGNCLHSWDAVQWLRLGQTIIAWRDAQRKAA